MRAYAILCLLHWKLYTLDTTYKPYKYRIIAAKNNNNNNTITWISYLLSLSPYLLSSSIYTRFKIAVECHHRPYFKRFLKMQLWILENSSARVIFRFQDDDERKKARKQRHLTLEWIILTFANRTYLALVCKTHHQGNKLYRKEVTQTFKKFFSILKKARNPL